MRRRGTASLARALHTLTQSLDKRACLAALALACAACGSDPSEAAQYPIGEWTSLLSGKWSLASGEEKYVCVRKTLTQSIFVTGFRPEASTGTHHTMLTIADGIGAEGVADCDGGSNGQVVLFASSYGTTDITLPEGVAVEVPAGTQLLLNVHLLNTSPEAIEGTTGTTALLLAEADVQQRAEVLLAGKVGGLEVVPGDSVQTGICTFPGETNVYAIMPHMHARGVHMKVTAKRADGDVPVLDLPYDVEDQHYRLTEPRLAMGAGDALEVECGYHNPSMTTYVFGAYSTDEMCYAISIRYPKVGGPAVCTE